MKDELVSLVFALSAIIVILIVGQIIYQIEVRKGKRNERGNKADRNKQ